MIYLNFKWRPCWIKEPFISAAVVFLAGWVLASAPIHCASIALIFKIAVRSLFVVAMVAVAAWGVVAGLPLNWCVLTILGTGLLDISCVRPRVRVGIGGIPGTLGDRIFRVSCIVCSKTTSLSSGFGTQTLEFTPPVMGRAFSILDCREQHVEKNKPCDKTDNMPYFGTLAICYATSLLDMGARDSYWNASAPAVDL